MSDKDFKSLFKAAKSARGGPQKLSKEQIKALKAQKAAAAPPAGQSTPAAGRAADRDAGAMPPPPPRQPSSKPPSQQPSAVSYHADSQATRMYNGGGAAPSAHPEPSVNQGPHLGLGAAASRQGSVRSTAGIFPGSTAASAAGSSGAAAAAVPREGPAAVAAEAAEGDAPQQQAEAAVSLEGSTGAVADAGGVAADLTSALSSQQRAAMRGQPSVASAVPAGFFDEAAAALSAVDTGVVSSPAPERGGSGETTGVAAGNGAQGPGAALPKGFFEDKKADAKARGEVPMTKKELDKEFADFLKQVDADAAEAAAQKAAEDAAEAVDKQDREEFEHIVRLQRIEDLRRAKAAGPAGTEEPTDDLAASARAAVSDPDVNMPAIQLPKKRKVADTLAELERDSMSEGDSDEGEAEELLDWRAKKSAF